MRSRPRSLAEPTPEVLDILGSYPQGICEIGAGDGRWQAAMRAAGIDCVGYDIHPRSKLVLEGSHEVAAFIHSNAVMLAVWPPGGRIIQDWIELWPGPRVALMHGGPARCDLGDALAGWTCEYRLDQPPGRKGANCFEVWRR